MLDPTRTYSRTGTPALISGSSIRSAYTSGNYQFTGNTGTLTLSAHTGQLGPGQRPVIWVSQAAGGTDNKVVIGRNIEYQTPYTNRASIPQFTLIVDGDIDIEFAEGVTSVSGLIFTRGDVRTCGRYNSHASTRLATTGPCSQKLTVRGVVIAGGEVFPYRTHGFGTSSDLERAETFDLTPESLISEYLRSGAQPNVRTTYQAELPPRL